VADEREYLKKAFPRNIVNRLIERDGRVVSLDKIKNNKTKKYSNSRLIITKEKRRKCSQNSL
jgi:hypothetical protein